MMGLFSYGKEMSFEMLFCIITLINNNKYVIKDYYQGMVYTLEIYILNNTRRMLSEIICVLVFLLPIAGISLRESLQIFF